MRPETAWWVERAFGRSGRLEDGVFVTDYSSLAAARLVGAAPGRARGAVSPPDLRREVADSLRRVRERHEGAPSKPAREAPAQVAEAAAERSSGPVTPERFGLLQALLAYLLAACGEERDAVIPAAELVERFQIPPEELEEHLSLLNLVNFGGGCYAVYAELHGDEVHVDKELFGDTFRSAAAADAARGARDPARARVRRPDDRRRRAHVRSTACARSSRRRSASSSSPRPPSPGPSRPRRSSSRR